jgi:TDG/mug DNA glycosylase family protein
VQGDEKTAARLAASVGFPPVSGPDARILILGSLPGQRSLQAVQYYAHAQNAFWRIMQDLVGAQGSYDERCDALVAHRIALWDVLAESVRPGSMDADIRTRSARANDFAAFFSKHANVSHVFFNGQKAAQLFRQLVVLDDCNHALRYATLPSTSPAYASMTYAEKFRIWREEITATD